MIIIMKPNASAEAVSKVKHLIESNGLTAHLSEGTEVTIVGVVGDKTKLQGANIEMMDGVDKIVAVTESYKVVNKKFHPEDSVITVGNAKIGPGYLTMMAGPCAIENHDMLLETAYAVKKSRSTVLKRRRLQAKNFPLRISGSGRRRVTIHERSQRGDRTECSL